MRKRLILAAALCMLVLPVWFSPSTGEELTTSAPFATVAYAGHTLLGDWCGCGGPGCICDPGELGGSSRPLPNKPEKAFDQSASPSHSRAGFDFGTGALVLALALMMWSRLRA